MADPPAITPVTPEGDPVGDSELVAHCKRQWLALHASIRRQQKFRRRFCRWVWKQGHFKQPPEGPASYRYLLYTAVLREVEHQEELDCYTVDGDDEDSPRGRPRIDPSSSPTAEDSPILHSPTRGDLSPPIGSPDCSPDDSPVSPAPALAPAVNFDAKGAAKALEELSPLVPLSRDDINRINLALKRGRGQDMDLSLRGRTSTSPKNPHAGRNSPSTRGPALPPPSVARRLLRQAATHLSQLPNVVDVDVPASGRVVVVGDIHGQFEDLLFVISREQEPGADVQYIFNGDFVDRGPDSCEVVFFLFTLMLLHPGCVWLNRGNHEDRNISARYGFGEEMRRKGYGTEVWEEVQRTFEQLPLVYVLMKGGRRKCVVIHGGLPDVEDVTLEEIREIDRRRPIPSSRNVRRPRPRTELPLAREDRVFQALMWSDPRVLPPGERTRKSDRGAGVHFSPEVSRDFLQKNCIDQHLIRSHDVAHSGYVVNHQEVSDRNTLCETVFSASNYHGPHSNQGAYIVVTRGQDARAETPLVLTPHQYFVRKSDDPSLQAQALDLAAEPDADPGDEVLKVLEKRALEKIGSLIFGRRAQLLVEFQNRDVKCTGRVTKRAWVEVMRTVCRDLPWFSLCRYLIRTESLGGLAYIPFLERFQNRLTRMWMQSWSQDMMRHVGFRLARCAKTVHSRLEQLLPCGSQARLSYYDVLQELNRAVPGVTPTGAYYLFVCEFDHNRDGFLDGDEWKSVVQMSTDQGGVPCVPELWGLRQAHGDDPRAPYGRLVMQLGDGIKPGAFVDLAMRLCNGDRDSADEVEAWTRTAQAFNSGGVVSAAALQAEVEHFGLNQCRAASMGEIIESIARAKMKVHTVFRLLDRDGSGDLCFDEFREGLGRLRLGVDPPPDWERTLFQEMDSDGRGRVTIDKFCDALSVTDTWPQDWLELTSEITLDQTPLQPDGKGGFIRQPSSIRAGSSLRHPSSLRQPSSSLRETSSKPAAGLAPCGSGGHAARAIAASPPMSPGVDGGAVHIVEFHGWHELRRPVAVPAAPAFAAEELEARARLLDREPQLRERLLMRLAVDVNRAAMRGSSAPCVVVRRAAVPGAAANGGPAQ